MRCTVALLRPWALAMVRVLQWVAQGGLVWVVACTTSFTRSALQETLAPEDDGGTADAHLSGNPAIGHTVGGQKGDTGSKGDAFGRVLGPDSGFQGSTLLRVYWEGIS